MDMTEEKMVEDIIDCIRAAGIDVVTDRSAMDSILGESLEGAYRSEMLQKYVITYAEGNRAPDLAPRSIVLKDATARKKICILSSSTGTGPRIMCQSLSTRLTS